MNRLKSHQRSFIAAAIGGPEIFAGRDMATAHAGLGIQIGGALMPLRADIVTVSEMAG